MCSKDKLSLDIIFENNDLHPKQVTYLTLVIIYSVGLDYSDSVNG